MKMNSTDIHPIVRTIELRFNLYFDVYDLVLEKNLADFHENEQLTLET